MANLKSTLTQMEFLRSELSPKIPQLALIKSTYTDQNLTGNILSAAWFRDIIPKEADASVLLL